MRTLDHPAFRSGDIHTGFIADHETDLLAPARPGDELFATAAAASSAGVDQPGSHPAAAADPWATLTGWGR